MLHRPGSELERLTPEFLSELLFDDIPWLRRIQEEHDKFAQALKDNGVKVYYVEDLLEEVLEDSAVKEFFIYDLVSYMNVSSEIKKTITNFFRDKTPKEIVNYAIAGLLKKEIIAIEIPKKRTFMHLDTVFTMVDVDKFLIYPGMVKDL